MSTERVQSGMKDAAPDLAPEPRRDTPSKRGIVNQSTEPVPLRQCLADLLAVMLTDDRPGSR